MRDSTHRVERVWVRALPRGQRKSESLNPKNSELKDWQSSIQMATIQMMNGQALQLETNTSKVKQQCSLKSPQTMNSCTAHSTLSWQKKAWARINPLQCKIGQNTTPETSLTSHTLWERQIEFTQIPPIWDASDHKSSWDSNWEREAWRLRPTLSYHSQ